MLYAPVASSTTKGIASFYNEHFIVVDGVVRIKREYLLSILNSTNVQSLLFTGVKLESEKNTDHYIVKLVLANGNVLTSTRLDF